jgi:hypothetical protein
MWTDLKSDPNAWLATGNNHGWWNHGGEVFALPKKLDVTDAPGWGTLIGKKAHGGIETGLQCPMCANSAAKKSAPRY